MKKVLSLTILALLVAGAAGLMIADTSYWDGNADQECVNIDILEPWTGVLVTTGSTTAYFAGYWGNDLRNDMICSYLVLVPGTQTWDVYEDSSYWDYYGIDTLYGTWDGWFRKSDGYAWGTWEASKVACSGTWWGNEQ